MVGFAQEVAQKVNRDLLSLMLCSCLTEHTKLLILGGCTEMRQATKSCTEISREALLEPKLQVRSVEHIWKWHQNAEFQ